MAVKVYKDGAMEWIDNSALDKFLKQGWSTSQDGSTATKKVGKVKAKPTISKKVEELPEENSEEEWDPMSGEDWADSIESVSAPVGERISDADIKTNEEE
jgi:hypothetical protein